MAKVPKQLYVVAKVQNGEAPLGFLHSYEPGKDAFKKKQETQHQWAYSSTINDVKFTEVDGVLHRSGVRWVNNPDPHLGYVRGVLVQVPAEPVQIQPAIWDNEPRTGFKILTSVSRYSTSNKLWRVLDPRGIQFEISTAAFEDIVLQCTIVKGEILEPCYWISTKTLKAVVK